MKHLNKFNEHDNYCTHCNGEGREPYCPFCQKSYLDELDKKKYSSEDSDDEDYFEDQSPVDKSLIQLSKEILDAAKLDVDAIEESDPDFIPYIADMIQKWCNQNR
jgi:hypothetical protein